MSITAQEVKKELEEMKKVGLRVTKKALEYPETHAAEMQEFRDGGMKIREIADYVITASKF
jgi:3-deoxy-D-manno-octulosonate 8-phosphate phosphatase KdsC-like HAD superfamily phosphatase